MYAKKLRFKKSFVFTLFLVSILCSPMVNVNAENIEKINNGSSLSGEMDSYMNTQINNINDLSLNQESDEKEELSADEVLNPNQFLSEEKVTVTSFGNKIVEKMYEVVGLLQSITKPLAIIMFIISAITVVTSIIFGTKKEKAGFLGLILSVFMYVGALFAPDLVLFFTQWLAS